MNKYISSFSICAMLLLISIGCGNGATTQKKANDNIKESDNRIHARAAIELRKTEAPELMSIMASGYFEYDMVFENQEMSKEGEHAGKWLKFQDDFTYTYGYYDEQQGSGIFHHNFDKAMILMLDDDKTKEPKEYQTKYGTSFMVFVGRNTYGNNAVQMKLTKQSNQPVKG